MSDFEYTLVISRDNAPALEVTLGHQSVRALAEAVSDEVAQLAYLSLLAEHPAAAVRAVVAARDCLSEAAVARLIQDPNAEVRRALIQSTAFRNTVETGTLLAMIETDVEVASAVAYSLGAFLEADPVALAEALATHSDPSVRTDLARCGDAPPRAQPPPRPRPATPT